MTDVAELLATLREFADGTAGWKLMGRTDILALLDHIERLEARSEECSHAWANYTEQKDRAEAAEAELARLRKEGVELRRLWTLIDGHDPDDPADDPDDGQRCRDCADNVGTCEHSGLPCDPQKAAEAKVKRMHAELALLRAPAGDELPDDLRAPLHSLQADREYLVARIRKADNEEVGLLSESIRDRLSQIEEAAYRLNGRLRAPAEARLREAGELMRKMVAVYDGGYSGHVVGQAFEAVRAFITKLEDHNSEADKK